METKISTFEGCEAVATCLAEKLVLLEKLQEEIISEKIKLYSQIRKNSEPLFSSTEWVFLNLKTVSRKTVFDFIVDCITADQSLQLQHKGKIRLRIDGFLIKITNDEINLHGFAYDSGRRKLEDVAQSIMDKFDIPLAFTEFDYDQKYLFVIQTTGAELDY